MIATVIGVSRVTGKDKDGRSYDYFRLGYTYSAPKGYSFEGLLGGTCNIGAVNFDVRVPHLGDRLVLDLTDNGRVKSCDFIEDVL